MEPSKPLMLKVPDAEERDDFLANARKVWNEHHSDKQKAAGRPPDARILDVMKDVLLGRRRKDLPTQYWLIEAVQEKFYDKEYLAKKFGDDTGKPSRDAIRKRSRLVHTLMKWAKEDTEHSLNDVGWVSENVPASQEAITQVLDTVSAILPDVTRIIESLEEIPGIVDKSGITMTEARRRTIQRVVLDFKKSPTPSHDK